jgi:adenine phosphoribosyltransferase
VSAKAEDARERAYGTIRGFLGHFMASETLEFDLRSSIRSIPDYPKPGIMFRDITTLLGNARAFRRAVDELVQPWAGSKIDKVAGMEARGFILGGAVAHQVSAGFIPIRKKGKLPHKRVSIAYSLEYGLDEMEMHEDAVTKGDKVILVDDLIATGGTAEGAVKLPSSRGPTCSPPASSSTCPNWAARTRSESSVCRCGR